MKSWVRPGAGRRSTRRLCVEISGAVELMASLRAWQTRELTLRPMGGHRKHGTTRWAGRAATPPTSLSL
eukprot:4717279-Pyramimonas_sp.AAC.1